MNETALNIDVNRMRNLDMVNLSRKIDVIYLIAYAFILISKSLKKIMVVHYIIVISKTIIVEFLLYLRMNLCDMTRFCSVIN